MNGFKIEIMVDAQGNIGIQGPTNLPPMALIGFFELAKGMVVQNILNPKSQPTIMPASANALDQLKAANGNGSNVLRG